MGWGVQGKLDTRALELAAATREAHERHILECRDRYLAMEGVLREIKAAQEDARRERDASSRRLYAMLWKTAASTISLLLMIIGYLLTHSAPWAATLGSH